MATAIAAAALLVLLSLTPDVRAAAVGASEPQGRARPSAVARVSTSRIILASQSCRDGIRRPKAIVFACADFGLSIDHLRWSSWGGRVARGHGTYRYNDCDPYCAARHFHASPAEIHLYRRRRCPGRSHLYYQDATVIPAGGAARKLFVGCPSV